MRQTRLVAAVAVLLGALARASAEPCPLNPSGGPDELALTVSGGRAEFAGHELPVVHGLRLRLCLRDCDSGTHPTCSVNGGTAAPRGTVVAPPLPLVTGGVALCLVTRLAAAPRGTADVDTGAVDVALGLVTSVFPRAGAQVCPSCSGSQPGASGVCDSGARTGEACVVDEVDGTGPARGLSRDCLPAGRPAASVAGDVALTSGTQRLSVRCAGRAARERTGTASHPESPWPDPTYPKRSRATLASVVCAAGTGDVLADPALPLPAPVGTLLDVTIDWLRAALTPTTTTVRQPPGVTTTMPGAPAPDGGGRAANATSTTTLPRGACRTAADCDDGDPCTDDLCTGGRCANVARGGVDGALCQVRSEHDVPLCGNEAIDPRLLKTIQVKLAAAERALARASEAASAGRRARLVAIARRSLEAVDRKTARSVGRKRISVPCAQSIDGAITAMRQPIADGGD